MCKYDAQFENIGAGSGTTVTREDKVKQILDEIIEKLPEEFNMVEIMNKVEERTPYVPISFSKFYNSKSHFRLNFVSICQIYYCCVSRM